MIRNTSFTDDNEGDNIQQSIPSPTQLPSSTDTSMEVMTPCAGYASSSSSSSLLMRNSSSSFNPTTVATATINTDVKKTKSPSSSSSSSSSSSTSLASVTVDGIQFVKSDMNGIYLRADKGNEPISSGSFVDFQVILNDHEFKELQQSKKAALRIGRHNNS